MGTFTFCNDWQRDQDTKWILITYHYLLEKDQEYEIWYLYHHFEQFYANRPDYFGKHRILPNC